MAGDATRSARPAAAGLVSRIAWRDGASNVGLRELPEETPVALTYNRAALAVMLATPADLEDFGIGFSLTEGIITHPAQVQELAVVAVAGGIELRMWLGADRAEVAEARRRRIMGPSGCGLCGVESLAEAGRPPPLVVSRARFSAAQIVAAISAMPHAQQLNQRTRAVHAAAFWDATSGLITLREDIGRHNALDKLAGALARAGVAAAEGLVLLSSRVSVELVQKVAASGAAVMVGVSAPTALAVRAAQAADITLIGIARPDGFEVFTNPQRIDMEPAQHVA